MHLPGSLWERTRRINTSLKATVYILSAIYGIIINYPVIANHLFLPKLNQYALIPFRIHVVDYQSRIYTIPFPAHGQEPYGHELLPH